jgi:hypothetical protein
MSDTKQGDYLKNLVAKLRELQEQADDVTEEIEKVLGGSVPLGKTLSALEGAFEQAWETRYKGRYVWLRARDRGHFKRLLKAMDADELRRRMAVYIKNGDPFYVQARHSFGLFVSSVNSHASHTVTAHEGSFELDAPADCRHTPRCLDDHTHTALRGIEMRVMRQ